MLMYSVAFMNLKLLKPFPRFRHALFLIIVLSIWAHLKIENTM